MFFLEINKMCCQLCCADVFLFLNMKCTFLCIWDFPLFIHLWHCWQEHSLCLCFKNPASKLYYAWVDFRVLHYITHICVKFLHATIKHRVIYRFTNSKQVHPVMSHLCLWPVIWNNAKSRCCLAQFDSLWWRSICPQFIRTAASGGQFNFPQLGPNCIIYSY